MQHLINSLAEKTPSVDLNGTAVIALHEVWKIYDTGEIRVEALRGITLEIARGEFVAIMGASGSGKSTMLNILGCLDRPTRGVYRLDGVDVSTFSPSQRADIRNREHRLHLSDLQPFEPDFGLGERGSPHALFRDIQGRPGPLASKKPWRWSEYPRKPRRFPTSSREGSSSEWRRPGPWSTARPSCWPTNPRATWTRRPPKRSWPFSNA